MKTKSKKSKIILRRDPEQTRGRILKEAAAIFAQYGFEGAPISAIIKKSKVNKRMIYHYFGDKEGLYRAIFLKQWGELKDWFDQALQSRLQDPQAPAWDVAELLSQSVGIYFDFMMTHQQFVRLMMWEGLEGGWISRSIWKDVRGPIYFQMEALVRGAQEGGFLNKELDAAHLIVSFLGAISFYFAYAPTLGDILHKDPFSEEALAERRMQVLQLLSALSSKP